jgi:two-component system response regulator YesN
MPYTVFLVEDEIVTREGIRDAVDWRGAGFEFCGEAPDGELALPLIEARQPDVLITDIKMPFMDGLQLSRLVRERLPATKIVILSGHDEFGYAQEAIKLGVAEYLLKPIGVREMRNLLARLAAQLDGERRARADLRTLQQRVESELPLRRERFLIRLLTVGADAAAAVAESRALGLDLVAVAFQVHVVRVDLAAGAGPDDFAACETVYQGLADLTSALPGAHLVKKDVDEFVVVLKGESPAAVQGSSRRLAALIHSQVAPRVRATLRTGAGDPQQRLCAINHSFSSALLALHSGRRHELESAATRDAAGAELLRLNKQALDDFLRYGSEAEFPAMFAAYAGALSPAALRSPAIRGYLLTDVVLAAARAVHQHGGSADALFAEFGNLPAAPTASGTTSGADGSATGLDALREQTRAVCLWALHARESVAGSRHGPLIQRARAYLEEHYAEPGLALNDVAAHVGLSPNHLSTVFSSEAGETIRDYVARLRMEQAKELLRTTNLSAAEICARVGYNDPHYFSAAFKRATGHSPRRFRAQAVSMARDGRDGPPGDAHE